MIAVHLAFYFEWLRDACRYCLSMKAEDHTGQTWMTAFDDTAQELLGQSAQHVQKLKEQADAVRTNACCLTTQL
eukprot:COSAG01_NODE_2476_length_7619_cov_35.526596_8_plen_74_part_00